MIKTARRQMDAGQSFYTSSWPLITRWNVSPSACAAFQGPVLLLRAPEGRAYLQAHGLTEVLSSCTHIAWATGGALVPETVRQTYQTMYL